MRKIITESDVSQLETGAVQINETSGLFISTEDCKEIIEAFNNVRGAGFRWAIPRKMNTLEKIIKEEVLTPDD